MGGGVEHGDAGGARLEFHICVRFQQQLDDFHAIVSDRGDQRSSFPFKVPEVGVPGDHTLLRLPIGIYSSIQMGANNSEISFLNGERERLRPAANTFFAGLLQQGLFDLGIAKLRRFEDGGRGTGVDVGVE